MAAAQRLELEHFKTQKELHEWIKKGTIRAGSTVKPSRRRREYQRIGYRGTMYYTETTNMHYAENELFRERMTTFKGNFRHNHHAVSNCPERAGKVYLIHGRRQEVMVGGNEFNVERDIEEHRTVGELRQFVTDKDILIGSLDGDRDLLRRRWVWYNHEGYEGTIHYATTNDRKGAEDWLRDQQGRAPPNGQFFVYVFIINTQMVAVALGPWASHSEDRAEP